MPNANVDLMRSILLGAKKQQEEMEQALASAPEHENFVISRSDLTTANYYLRTLTHMLERTIEEDSQ
jgi:hypothetical protein